MNNNKLTTLVGTGCLVMGMFLGYAGRLARDTIEKNVSNYILKGGG